VDTTSRWEDELGRWLEPFLDRLGHKARRRMCPLYVSGLIGPGDRKSVQPMAARLAKPKRTPAAITRSISASAISGLDRAVRCSIGTPARFRRALMTMIAYAFLQSRRLTAAGRKKRVPGPPPQPSMPAIRQAILDLFVRPPPLRCTHCEMLLARRLQLNLPK
jgi:DDE superfamily endonuclease